MKLRCLPLLAAITFVQASSATAQMTARLSIKRVWGGPPGSVSIASTNPYWLSATNVSNMVSTANTILAAGGGAGTVSLQWSPTTDLIDIIDPAYPASFYDVTTGPSGEVLHAMEAACELDPSKYAYRADAINVYLVNSVNAGTVGGTCSAPMPISPFSDQDDLIVIAIPPQPTTSFLAYLLAHEIGHYFGLFHTFEASVNPPELAPTPCSVTGSSTTLGDLVADTPADPYNPLTSTSICADLAALPTPTYYSTCPYALSTLPGNVMAYYLACNNNLAAPRFTPGQRTRMQSFFGTRSRVDTTISSPQISLVTPSFVDYSAGTTQLDINGSFLPTAGNPSNGSVTVVLGALLQSPLFGGAYPTFVPEAVAPAMDLSQGQSIRATFATPIPPGRHTVTIRVDGSPIPSVFTGQVVASLARGVTVTPFVDVVYAHTNSTLTTPAQIQTAIAAEQYVMELGTAAATQLTFGVEAVNSIFNTNPALYPQPLTPPNPIFGTAYLLWLNQPNPILTTIATFPGGFAASGWLIAPFSLIGSTTGTRVHGQMIENFVSPTSGLLQFTNVIPLGVP